MKDKHGQNFHLVIVRHATAEDPSHGQKDSERKLTSKGKKQAKHIAKVCDVLGLPKPQCVFTSGFKRANETLRAFAFSKKIDVVKSPHIEPDGDILLAVAEVEKFFASTTPHKKKSKVVWVVGHQPHLDKFVRKLSPALKQCFREMPKSSVVWLSWKDAKLGKAVAELRAYLPQPS